MKAQWLINGAYIVLGMLLFSAYEHGISWLGMLVYQNDLEGRLIACQLATKHAYRFANIELASPLKEEVEKTSIIDLLTCDDYQTLRNKLLALGVSETRLKIIEADAFRLEPELTAQSGEYLPSKQSW